jgi:glycosyltransferase involved in cell wall biosynthesis
MSKSLRIAMLVPCPFPANHGTPGAIRELSGALGERGHNVEIVTYPLCDESIPVDGLVIHRVAVLGTNRNITVGPSWQRLGFDALLVPKLIQTIRSLRADIIHAHNFEGALAGFPARLITGRPLIYNAINTMIDELHTYDFIRPKALAVGFSRILDFWVPRLANHVIADTQQLYEFILKKGVSPHRAEVVPSGVNVSMFSGKSGEEIRQRYGLQDKPLVIYTGTFDRFQGIDELMSAFPEVVSKCPNAVLMLVGGTVSDTHSQHYRRMANELSIESNVIITSTTLEELPDYLAAADLAVAPRVCETAGGIPTKLLNYMAAAKAIVCHKSSAAFLNHLESAWLVPSGEPGEFAEGILSILRDPVVAARLGDNARRLADTTYSWHSIARRVEEVYLKVLGLREHGRDPRDIPIRTSDVFRGGASPVQALPVSHRGGDGLTRETRP